MANFKDSNRKAQWEQELSSLRQQRQARRDGVEYVPQPVQEIAQEPQQQMAAMEAPQFYAQQARVEISIEQLTAEANGRVYHPEQISYERVSTLSRERDAMDIRSRT